MPHLSIGLSGNGRESILDQRLLGLGQSLMRRVEAAFVARKLEGSKIGSNSAANTGNKIAARKKPNATRGKPTMVGDPFSQHRHNADEEKQGKIVPHLVLDFIALGPVRQIFLLWTQALGQIIFGQSLKAFPSCASPAVHRARPERARLRPFPSPRYSSTARSHLFVSESSSRDSQSRPTTTAVSKTRNGAGGITRHDGENAASSPCSAAYGRTRRPPSHPGTDNLPSFRSTWSLISVLFVSLKHSS